MFNIKADRSSTGRDQGWRDTALALSAWFMVNNLRTKTPMVDPVLAKIYFDTYAIPIGESISNIKEAANEYEPDIIRFFLLNQRQRCEDIMSEISRVFKNINIVLPIQCKPFFEEMITMSEKIRQHNIQTKETQVLDSLRDTIIANSLDYRKTVSARIDVPQHIPVRTSGKYILTDGEKASYLDILGHVVRNLYMPMFSGLTPSYVPNVYAMTDIYEDSGTRFAKVIEYIKSALFMICNSYDERISCGYCGPGESVVPSLQDDMFGIIDSIAGRCETIKGYYDSIAKECSRYGGFTIPHAICLPPDTHASLACFKPEKNAISLTYKFLVCQSYFDLLSYKTVTVN